MELRNEQQANDLGEPRACATVGGCEGNVYKGRDLEPV